jgi:hypothetical protein
MNFSTAEALLDDMLTNTAPYSMAHMKPEEEHLRSDMTSANIVATYIPKAPDQVRPPALRFTHTLTVVVDAAEAALWEEGAEMGGVEPRPPSDPRDFTVEVCFWCVKTGHNLLCCTDIHGSPAKPTCRHREHRDPRQNRRTQDCQER